MSRRIVLGDGAPWIWNLAQEMFPGAVEIVDRFHAKEHLSNAAKGLYPDAQQNSSNAAKEWPSSRRSDDSEKNMAFRVEVSPQAFNDLDEIARYIKQQASFEQAEEWFNGIMIAIRTLEDMPSR